MATPTWNRKPSVAIDQITNKLLRRPNNYDFPRLSHRSESFGGLPALERLDKGEVDLYFNRSAS